MNEPGNLSLWGLLVAALSAATGWGGRLAYRWAGMQVRRIDSLEAAVREQMESDASRAAAAAEFKTQVLQRLDRQDRTIAEAFRVNRDALEELRSIGRKVARVETLVELGYGHHRGGHVGGPPGRGAEGGASERGPDNGLGD